MKVTHSYQLVRQRIDVVAQEVTRAGHVFVKGDQVLRISSRTVSINGCLYPLSEKYTKFFGYTREG